MIKHSRMLWAALLALLIVSVASGAASALRSISVSGVPAGGAVQASGVLVFGESRLTRPTQIICSVTLLRTIVTSIPKTVGTQFGSVTGVAIRLPCEHGEAFEAVDSITALKTNNSNECREIGGGVRLCVVDWKLVYKSFLGVLPEIEGILFEVEPSKFLFRVHAGLGVARIGCLYSGNTPALFKIRRETGKITEGEPLLSIMNLTPTQLEGEGFTRCPSPGVLSGTFLTTPELTIHLI